MQPSDDPLPQKSQNERLMFGGDKQVQHPEDGYVFAVSDEEYFRRFLFLGKDIAWQDSKPKEDVKRKKVGDLIEKMIQVEKVDVVAIISKVSADKMNLRQDQLLRAFAICCESRHDELRKKAYTILNTVCRTPWHLFTFLHECAGSAKPKGWDSTKKKAVGEWYKQFESKPFDLAMMVTKYKKRQGWSHKDVLRMAHVKCTEEEPKVAFILSYIMKGYTKAYEDHKIAEKKELTELADRLKMYDNAKSYNGKTYRDGSSVKMTEFYKLIRDNHLCWEHVAWEMLEKREVWEVLLEDMPVEAMLKSLGRLTRLSLFDDEQNIEKVEEILKKKDVHPFKVLITFYQYCQGESRHRKELGWVPNMRIKKALEDTFYKKSKRYESSKKRVCLAIDVSESMNCKVQVKCFKCIEAAVAMATMILKTEDGNVISFSDKVVKHQVDKDTKLDEAMKVVTGWTTDSSKSDCTLPIKWAVEKKDDRKTDVFVIFTDSLTWSGNTHVVTALEDYRRDVVKDAKLVVCTMRTSEFTIIDPVDDNVLNINGFDPGAVDCLKGFLNT